MVTNGMIGLFFIVRLFCLILAQGEYYYIEGEISQLTLTTGANLTIKCMGWPKPVTWEQDKIVFTQKNSPIKVTNEINVKNDEYKSLLHLTNVSILDIGYYYCGPTSANISKNEEKFKKIYIFVQDDKYLLTISGDKLYQNESGDVIIPCRPTSPNIDVTIKKNNTLITKNIHYDEKIGYTHWFFWQDEFQNYTCEANKNNLSEFQQFTIYKNPNATKVIITDGNLDQIYTDQNITLKCIVYTYSDKNINVEWDFPDNLMKSGNVRNGTEKIINFKHYTMVTNVLHIRNITAEDYGSFTCKVKFDSGSEKINKYKPPKIISLESDYLNLKIVNGKQSIVCRQGSEVEWEIQASSNRNITFEWKKRDVQLYPLEYPDKYIFELKNNTSKLIIKNVQSSDAEKYSLSAFSSSSRMNEYMYFYVQVEVIPSIQLFGYFSISTAYYDRYIFPLTEYFNLNTIYYEPNKVQYFDIHIIGYPFPKFELFFQNCSRNFSIQSCQNEPVIIKDIIILSEKNVHLTIAINVTENGKLIFNASNYLGYTTEKYEIVLTDLEILPNTSEHFLRPDSPMENRTLVCKGNLPIQWHFKQYDETLIIKTNFSKKISIKEGATQYYLSILQLEKANYLDTGYYYCSPLMAEKKFIITNFKNIYVFVEDEARLFAFPSDSNTLIFNEYYGRYVIPCRPTSKDVKIYLESESHREIDVEEFYYNQFNIYDEKVFFYDNKVGYIYLSYLYRFQLPMYECVATKNGSVDELKFTNFPRNVHIVREGGDSNTVIEGQSLNLKCMANIPTIFLLEWNIDAKLRNKTSHVDQPKIFKYQGSILLSLPYVTVEDNSEIACVFHDEYYGEAIPFLLNIIKPDTPFLTLNILEGRDLTIRQAGFHVQWTVQISANPKPNIKWSDQYGNNLSTWSKKFDIQGGDNISVLIINDIQPIDSGVYTLTAQNGNYTKEISVTLLVEDKPSIHRRNSYYSKDLYDVGKVADFEFYVYGYPLPKSVCTFQKFSIFPSYGTEYTQIPVIKNKTINITDVSVKLSISMNVTETGELICSADNRFGISVKKYSVMATDIPEGFFVNGPSIILTGDTVILDCGVSIYYYRNRIKWTISHDSSNHTGWNISENKTQFSYHSYLMIQNISKEFNGYINCTVEKKRLLLMGPETETKSFFIKTEDKQETYNSSPIIYGVIFSLIIVILIGCITCCIRRKKSNKKLTLGDMLNFQNYDTKSWNPRLSVDEQADLLPYDKNWEFPIQNLKLGKQLGSGAFGIVFKGTAIGITNPNTTTTVAVKTIKPTTDPRVANALISELKIMANLGCHLNIVNLLGACTGTINKKLMVIVEYCHFGCIHQYLLKHRDSFINQMTPDNSIDCNIQTTSANSNSQNYVNIINTSNAHDSHSSQIESESYSDNHEIKWSSKIQGDYKNMRTKPVCTCDLINWSFQISRGMDYLSSKKIIHGDLAARNILLSEGNIVKICDFGLAKNLYYSEVYKLKSKKNLPFKWMAIESIGDQVFSTKSDVWSFGIVLWEVFSLAATPYPSIQLNDLYDKLVDGYRMNRPKYANSEIYNIMSNCWIAEPSKRPSFSKLAENLGSLLQKSTKVEYIEPNANDVRMSKEKSFTSDIISLLTDPNYRNYAMSSKGHSNSQTNNNEHSDSQSNFELQPMLRSAVYDFKEAESH